MHTLQTIRAMLNTHQPGWGLPQVFYTDAAIFQHELHAIWQREWIFAGLSCELQKPGSHFVVDVARASVIICRGEDGQIRAFHNTCRHRGSRICLHERGASRNLTCPYHQWTYTTRGKLLFARDMGADFDKSRFGLKPVPLQNVAGYLFICLAEGEANPPDFSAFAQEVAPYLMPHGLQDAKVAYEATIIERANWKLVLENNRECYHCKGSHPELLRTIAEVEDTRDPRCSPTYRAKAQQDEARWQAQGLPYRLTKSPSCNDGKHGWQIVRVPMNRGLSFTMGGAPACQRLMGTLPDFDVGSVRLLHFPNTWNHALGDHAIAFRVLPVNATTTALTTKWLVHKDAVEGVDYALDDLTAVWQATNDQDRTLAENSQRGIASLGYQPGPYSAEMEAGVLAFIDWYTGKMRAHASVQTAAS